MVELMKKIRLRNHMIFDIHTRSDIFFDATKKEFFSIALPNSLGNCDFFSFFRRVKITIRGRESENKFTGASDEINFFFSFFFSLDFLGQSKKSTPRFDCKMYLRKVGFTPYRYTMNCGSSLLT